MKKLTILSLLVSSLFQTSYSQELSYSVSYQDNEAVINHVTCRLAIDAVITNATQEHQLLDILEEKGYTAYFPQTHGVVYSPLGRATNVFEEDLIFSIRIKYTNSLDYISFEGKLGYLDESFLRPLNFWMEAIPMKDFEPFASSITNKKRYKKSLEELYHMLPSCISHASGHSYEEEIFHKSIAQGQIASCIELGDKKIKKLRQSEFQQFFRNVGRCYARIQNGERCHSFSANLTYGLNKKTKEVVRTYLKHLRQEELTQKIADYLAETKVCSQEINLVKKLSVKKLLRKVRKTL